MVAVVGSRTAPVFHALPARAVVDTLLPDHVLNPERIPVRQQVLGDRIAFRPVPADHEIKRLARPVFPTTRPSSADVRHPEPVGHRAPADLRDLLHAGQPRTGAGHFVTDRCDRCRLGSFLYGRCLFDRWRLASQRCAGELSDRRRLCRCRDGLRFDNRLAGNIGAPPFD